MIYKTQKMLEVEKKVGMPIERWLKNLYSQSHSKVIANINKQKIAKNTFYMWLRLVDIPIKKYGKTDRGEKDNPPKKLLRHKYLIEFKSPGEIAVELNSPTTRIRSLLIEYGIPLRNRSEAHIKGSKIISKDKLYQEYIERKKSAYTIEKEHNLSSGTIYRLLNEYGISIRSISEALLIGKKLPSKEEVYQKYVLENKGYEELCNEYNISKTTFFNILRRHKIKKDGRKKNERIKSPQQLSELLNTEPNAKFALENVVQFADPDQLDVAVADVLSVVWDGRIKKEDLLKMLEEPSLKKYLGGFARSNGGLTDLSKIGEAGENLLRYDKNGVIRDLIKRRIESVFYDGSLGPNPSSKEIYSKLNDMKKEKGNLK